MAKAPEFSVSEWLAEQLKGAQVSDEERKAVEKVLAQDAVAKNISASVMRHSDYSRRQDELRQERESFDADRKKINQQYQDRLAELSTWEGTAKQKLAEEEKARKQAEAAAAAAQRKYAKAVKEAGLDPADLGLDDDDDLDPPPRRQPAFDPAKEWEAREAKLRAELKKEFENGAAELVKVMGPYPIQLMQLQAEHQRLFPEQPLDVGALYKQSVEKGKPMDEIWADQFHVADRRAEMAQKAIDDQISQARADERRKVTEELARPPMIEPESYGSPAMKKFAAKPGSSEQDGLSGIERAVIAARQHKHAPPSSPHWKGHQNGA